jgi:transcriptional antiterminator RfaH
MFAEWFVVRSKPGQVARALSNLKRQNYESYAPKCFDPLTRKHSYLFVDYLFVKMPFTAQWRSIRSTYGVLEIVVFGECPATITQEEINRLRDRENDLGVIEMPSDPFVLDEGLRVKSGPFEDCLGLYQGMTNDQRVIVLMELLGRKVKLNIERYRVEKAA